MARAIYRGYWSGGKRSDRVTRLHIVREGGPAGWEPGKQTLCGQHAWTVQHSDPVIIDPMPDRPPEGLSWCPKCIGLLAERAGLLDVIASDLAGYGWGYMWPHLTEALQVKRDAEISAARAARREQLAAAASQ